MSGLIDQIRTAQRNAAEDAVTEKLRDLGLLDEPRAKPTDQERQTMNEQQHTTDLLNRLTDMAAERDALLKEIANLKQNRPAEPRMVAPDGTLHADGYFTWARRDGYVMDHKLPTGFVLAATAQKLVEP